MGEKLKDEVLKEYRAQLVDIEQKAQEDYDKASLALNGGALGVSMAFVKDMLPEGVPNAANLLLSAWVCWGVGVMLVLASHFFASLANRKAILQVDAKTIRSTRPGGGYDVATLALNFAHGTLFVIGAILMIVFAFQNLEV